MTVSRTLFLWYVCDIFKFRILFLTCAHVRSVIALLAIDSETCVACYEDVPRPVVDIALGMNYS